MKPPLYWHTLKRDLEQWIEDGLVPANNRDAILARARTSKNNLTAVGIFAMLGAVFMVLAALTFIGANWGGIAKIVRFGLVLTLMWSALGVTLYALKHKQSVFAHAFALIATALFGVGVMLVAQIFNIAAHFPNGIFIWAIGALAVAIAMPSRPVLLLAAGLAALWMHVSYTGPLPGFNPLIWLLAPLLIALWAGARHLRAIASAHLITLTLLVWAIYLTGQAESHDYISEAEAISMYAVFALTVLLWAGLGRAHNVFAAPAVQIWSGITLLITAFFVQFSFISSEQTLPPHSTLWAFSSGVLLVLIGTAMVLAYRAKIYTLMEAAIPIASAIILLGISPLSASMGTFSAQIIYGAMFFAGALLSLIKGAQSGQTYLLWLGGVAFIIEALYVYFETFKDLLSTSIFFLVGGLLMLAIALIAMRFGKHFSKGAAR